MALQKMGKCLLSKSVIILIEIWKFLMESLFKERY